MSLIYIPELVGEYDYLPFNLNLCSTRLGFRTYIRQRSKTIHRKEEVPLDQETCTHFLIFRSIFPIVVWSVVIGATVEVDRGL